LKKLPKKGDIEMQKIEKATLKKKGDIEKKRRHSKILPIVPEAGTVAIVVVGEVVMVPEAFFFFMC
jgi:hypothetical protein